MSDYYKSIVGTIFAIGLMMLAGIAVIVYSLLAAAGALPSSDQEKIAAAPVTQSSDENLLAAAVPAPSSNLKAAAAPAAQSPQEGQAIFAEKCIICHTIGEGILVGPDLSGVTDRRDRDWLARWIREPDKMLAEGDPLATELFEQFNNVPMLNQGLTEAQVAAVIAYLETQTGEASVSQAVVAPAATLPPGDPNLGRAIFTGASPPQNGGPACISCHSNSEIGALGGGSLGPDLTNVYARYGEAGLASALKSLPFPTMQGVFGDKPLTETEAANLYAYFVQTDQTAPRPLDMTVPFVVIGFGASLVLGLAGHLTWRRRLTGVRRPLLKRTG